MYLDLRFTSVRECFLVDLIHTSGWVSCLENLGTLLGFVGDFGGLLLLQIEILLKIG